LSKLSISLFLFGAVAGCTLIAPSVYASTSSIPAKTEAVSIFVDDKQVQFPDAAPFIDPNDRTQVPVRFVSQELGYQVNWNMEGSNVHVTLKNGSDTIDLHTNDDVVYRNGQAVQMDTKPMLYANRTYVPLRFVAEALNSKVEWDGANHMVHVYQGDASIAEDKNPHPSQSNNNEQAIIDYAKKFLGTPYIFGGTGTSGFDCSGYVQYVFAHNGIQLPRTAAQMFTLGSTVTDLQPGDLVFFTTYQPGASHVGIYLGNQQFISATSSHGVSISTLDNPYWGPRYLGAKRL
jgi:peptidoglycan DL-endopeptidase LytE